MIRAERSLIPKPESLSEAKYGPQRNQPEAAAILEALTAHVDAHQPLTTFTFPFAAYSSPDVKKALHLLFRGKCAYCESRYASTQPMDVEHWRPKGVVHVYDDNTGEKIDTLVGYPWLAATWENLLPSCIDCNRSRFQDDALTGRTEVLGKKNQFPVIGPRLTVSSGASFEDAQLLNPTYDQPAQHLDFRDDGLVIARAASPKGMASIRVYALNRSELAFERLGLARLVAQRLKTIDALTGFLDRPTVVADATLSLDIEDLIAHEIDALYALAKPNQPYSAMVKQLIEQNRPTDPVPIPAAPSPPPQAWSAEVATVLRRFTHRSRNVDHVALARDLVSLGFEPHFPVARGGTGPSTIAYIRWTYQGYHRLSLFQNTRGLVSDSHGQLAAAKALPGAEGPHGVHPKLTFRHVGASYAVALAAAESLKQWADQP